MPELLLTRHTPHIDPALAVWGWEIPVYLFLGGCVAGLMVLAGHAWLTRGREPRPFLTAAAPWIALALLSAGMGALFLDLEHKAYVWRLYTTFQIASPMSWGAWILLLVYPALLAAGLVALPGWMAGFVPGLPAVVGRLNESRSAQATLAGVLMALGIALGTYTGILLSALPARPLWNSAILGPLFLVSGLSSAAALAHLATPNHDEHHFLIWADMWFIGGEIVLLGLLLLGLVTGPAVQRAAAQLVLGGAYTSVFWVGVVGLGLLMPLLLQGLALAGRLAHTVAMPVLVLAGGLALRIVLVYAGQASGY